jgi:lipopolysaccharide transport system ATP-binding protein
VAPKISVDGLTKVFALHRREKVKGISTDLGAAVKYLMKRTVFPGDVEAAPKRGSKDFLYALDNVSFEVQPGEVLGVIGRNGAGKSTLLKIMSRLLDPTEGQVTIRGRVASLLDLGIGFAPDLTVRENIQMYGRLSGFPAAHVRVAEDKIISMAGLTEFRDAPLESCPSGSYIQLAFSAMTGLDADVILADEVLTLGSSAFRQACEQRILAAGQSGESVLLVSHDMNAIKRCCSRVLWIDKGHVRQIGPTEQVVAAYTRELLAGHLLDATGNSTCRILDLRLLDANREQIGAVQMTEPSYVDCLFRIERPDHTVTVKLELWAGKDLIFTCRSPSPIRANEPATYHAGIRIPAHFFNERSYQARWQVYVEDKAAPSGEAVLAAEESLEFSVMNPNAGESVWGDWMWGRTGVISPRLQWTMCPEGHHAVGAETVVS